MSGRKVTGKQWKARGKAIALAKKRSKRLTQEVREKPTGPRFPVSKIL